MNSRFRYFLTFLLPLCAICALALLMFQRLELRANIDSLQSDHELQAELEERALLGHLAIVLRDLRFLANHSLLQDLMTNPTPESLTGFSEIVRSFSQVSGIYDQMRWIDIDGMERIRVNLTSNGAETASEPDLQYQGDRDYFSASANLDRGGIYVSALDLNVVNGEIEVPHKPMLRFAMPVFDQEGGRRGVFVLNYLASFMLDDFAETMLSSPQDGYILNTDGYWLRGPSKDLEWGFMFNNAITLAQQDPALWGAISAQEEGSWSGESGYWVWRTVAPAQALEIDKPSFAGLAPTDTTIVHWKVVIRTSPEQLAALQGQLGTRVLVLSVPLFLVLVLLSWYISVLIYSRKIAWQNLEDLATKDGLTGLLNHRAFMVQMQTFWEGWRRRQDIPISVVMLDLDHFKYVNDTYGHQAGDVVLHGFARIIQSNLRQTDIAGRIGGEEFAVVLFDCDVGVVRLFAERIRAQVQAEVFHHEAHNITITVSLGAAMYGKQDAAPTDALERADKALYRAKENGRNRVELEPDSAG